MRPSTRPWHAFTTPSSANDRSRRQAISRFFEQLVVDLVLAMGYGGSRDEFGHKVGRRHDGGIDGIIKEDCLGLDSIYIQAKRWEGSVGRKEIQAFVSSLEMHRASKGIFLTTSQLSREALDHVQRIGKKGVLIDGEALANLMVECKVGISVKETIEIKKIDLDYFEGDGWLHRLFSKSHPG